MNQNIPIKKNCKIKCLEEWISVLYYNGYYSDSCVSRLINVYISENSPSLGPLKNWLQLLKNRENSICVS